MLSKYTEPRSLTSKFNQCACKCLPLQAGELGIFFQAPVMPALQLKYSAEKVICLVLKLTVEVIFVLLLPVWLLSTPHVLWPCFFVSNCTSSQAIPILAGHTEPSVLGHPLPPSEHTWVHSTQFSFPKTDSPLSKASLILPALLHHSLLPSDGDLIPDVVSAHFFFSLSLRFNLLSRGGITSCLSLDLHIVNSKAHLWVKLWFPQVF